MEDVFSETVMQKGVQPMVMTAERVFEGVWASVPDQYPAYEPIGKEFEDGQGNLYLPFRDGATGWRGVLRYEARMARIRPLWEG